MAQPRLRLQVMAEEIATVAADQPAPGGGRLLDDPAFARKLADARIRTEVLEILEYRVLAAVAEAAIQVRRRRCSRCWRPS